MKKELFTRLIIILFIFSLGFLIRFESIYLSGTPDSERSFYESSNGHPYMYELDSYYHYRLTHNLLDHGYMGDTKINGREWDLHSYYPPGVPLDYPPMIIFLTAFFYYLINIFAYIPLLVVSFWVPIFIGPLSGILAYFLTKRFTNDYGAIAAGIFVVTAPIYVLRTVPGWFDTDMFIIFFPLLITWLFIEAVHSRNNFNRGILFAFLTALVMLLFSLAWNGWQYMFYFINIYSASFIIWCGFKGKKVKKISFILITFFISTILLLCIFTGFINILKLLSGPLEFLKIFGNQNPWISWPDVYSTVSELRRPTLEEAISAVGLAFFAGIFGFIWMFRLLINKNLKKRFLNKMNWFYYLYLVSWAALGFIALSKGGRFLMILIPPLAISSGIFIGIAVGYLELFKTSQRFEIFRRKNLIKFIAILILVWITVPAVLNVHQSIFIYKPMVNDDLWAVSEWINNYTSNDTVIISHWSYGHLFTAIADRPVSFDGRMGYVETLPGRSFDTAYTFQEKVPGIYREYWIDRALSTSNESLSIGIFRMLATSGDLAYLTLYEYTENTTISVEILNYILGLEKSSAKEELINKYHLNQEQTEKVLKYTHPDNPHPYVLVTNDGMRGIGGVILKYGEWDFNQNQPMNYTYSYSGINDSPETMKSNDGIFMDKKTGKISWKGKTPYCVITVSKGTIEKKYLDQNSDFCVILLMDDKKSVVIDRKFENSLFTKLIIEKTNSTYFEPIYKTNTVLVWKSKK